MFLLMKINSRWAHDKRKNTYCRVDLNDLSVSMQKHFKLCSVDRREAAISRSNTHDVTKVNKGV